MNLFAVKIALRSPLCRKGLACLCRYAGKFFAALATIGAGTCRIFRDVSMERRCNRNFSGTTFPVRLWISMRRVGKSEYIPCRQKDCKSLLTSSCRCNLKFRFLVPANDCLPTWFRLAVWVFRGGLSAVLREWWSISDSFAIYGLYAWLPFLRFDSTGAGIVG